MDAHLVTRREAGHKNKSLLHHAHGKPRKLSKQCGPFVCEETESSQTIIVFLDVLPCMRLWALGAVAVAAPPSAPQALDPDLKQEGLHRQLACGVPTPYSQSQGSAPKDKPWTVTWSKKPSSGSWHEYCPFSIASARELPLRISRTGQGRKWPFVPPAACASVEPISPSTPGSVSSPDVRRFPYSSRSLVSGTAIRAVSMPSALSQGVCEAFTPRRS